MPLLGKKVFHQAKPLRNLEPDVRVFIIKHTGECFKSKDEFESRLRIYGDAVWTCQSTGKMNLTHEEAWKSEQEVMQMIKKVYPAYLEKPVLEIVHHSTLSLETLVDKSYIKLHTTFAPGEQVEVKLPLGKMVQGHVIRIESNQELSVCDKENSNDGDCNTNEGATGGKHVIKLLPLTYSVKCDGSSEPDSFHSSDLSRVDRLPSKDLIRLFIKSHAVRYGTLATSPWVVEPKTVKRYSLPSKFAEFLLQTTTLDSPPKKPKGAAEKRPRKTAGEKPGLKKVKMSNGQSFSFQPLNSSFSIDPIHTYSKGISPVKLGPRSPPEVITLEDEDDSKTATFSALNGSRQKLDHSYSSLFSTKPKKMPAVVLTPVKLPTSPKKKPSSSAGSPPPKKKKADGADAAKSPKKKATKKDTGDKPKKPRVKKEKATPGEKKKKAKVAKKKDGTPKKAASPKKEGSTKKDGGSAKKSPKKQMKQLTLHELAMKSKSPTSPSKKSPTKKTPPTKSPKKTPTSSPKKKLTLPPYVRILVSEGLENKSKVVKNLMTKALKELTAEQRNLLPLQIKDSFIARYNRFVEVEKLKAMTPEQKEEYRKQRKREQCEKHTLKKAEERKKLEDRLVIDALPLPQFKLVSMPDGIPNELFGEIAMILEFISCYSGLLMPSESYPITSDLFMKCLVSGSDGFCYLSNILIILLQTLTNDGIAEDYREIGIPLTHLPINKYTASELTRLCLRSNDESTDDEQDDSGGELAPDVPDAMLNELEMQEIFDLDCRQKLQIITGLLNRLMMSYSVQNHLGKLQKIMSDFWKRKLEILKKTKQEKAAEKAKADADPKTPSIDNKPEQNGVKSETTGTKSTGKKVAKKAEDAGSETPASALNDSARNSGTSTPNNEDDVEGNDLASMVKRRRLMAQKAKLEKELKEKLAKELLHKEIKKQKDDREQDSFEKQLAESIQNAKFALRMRPLGTDRNHSRYWYFPNSLNGLFIEKGWVHQNTNYSVTAEPKSEDASAAAVGLDESDSESEAESEEAGEKEAQPTGAKKPAIDYSALYKTIPDETFPQVGQNLWFAIDTPKELDQLIEALSSKGYRESALKEELKKRHDDIVKNIQNKRAKFELKKSNGDKELREKFQLELDDVVTRLDRGLLGGVKDYESWNVKLNKAMTVQEMGELMIEVQRGVIPKFLLVPKGTKLGAIQAEESETSNPAVDDETGEAEATPKPKNSISPEQLLAKWREKVDQCQTYSRLHVLLGILEACVKWEKSTYNAKCKVCRRKDDDDIILCDKCSQAYHFSCLRPCLKKAPDGDWFCPACAPEKLKARSCRTRQNYDEEEEDDDDDDEEEQAEAASEDEEEYDSDADAPDCCLCGGDEDVAVCRQCARGFHIFCHEPNLRRLPRAPWICIYCMTGKRLPKSKAAVGKKSSAKKPAAAKSKPKASEPKGRAAAIQAKRSTRRQAKDDSDSDSSEPQRVLISRRTCAQKASQDIHRQLRRN